MTLAAPTLRVLCQQDVRLVYQCFDLARESTYSIQFDVCCFFSGSCLTNIILN